LARRGVARLGGAGQGMAWHGKDFMLLCFHRRVTVWRGVAWRGSAWLGEARRGIARQGMAR